MPTSWQPVADGAQVKRIHLAPEPSKPQGNVDPKELAMSRGAHSDSVASLPRPEGLRSTAIRDPLGQSLPGARRVARRHRANLRSHPRQPREPHEDGRLL